MLFGRYISIPTQKGWFDIWARIWAKDAVLPSNQAEGWLPVSLSYATHDASRPPGPASFFPAPPPFPQPAPSMTVDTYPRNRFRAVDEDLLCCLCNGVPKTPLMAPCPPRRGPCLPPIPGQWAGPVRATPQVGPGRAASTSAAPPAWRGGRRAPSAGSPSAPASSPTPGASSRTSTGSWRADRPFWGSGRPPLRAIAALDSDTFDSKNFTLGSAPKPNVKRRDSTPVSTLNIRKSCRWNRRTGCRSFPSARDSPVVFPTMSTGSVQSSWDVPGDHFTGPVCFRRLLNAPHWRSREAPARPRCCASSRAATVTCGSRSPMSPRWRSTWRSARRPPAAVQAVWPTKTAFHTLL